MPFSNIIMYSTFVHTKGPVVFTFYELYVHASIYLKYEPW